MVDARPVLVGMNNPFSADPNYALFPAPRGVTGHNLFLMLQDRIPGLFRKQYLDAFDRRNVLDSTVWDRKEAKRVAWGKVWCEPQDRTVVYLGRDVLWAVGLPTDAEPLRWFRPAGSILEDGGPSRWCYMPHPSGMNRWYNDPVNRLAASLRLEQLYMESIG